MRAINFKDKLDLANKFGVFASSLLVTTMAFYIWSPILGSNADDAISRVSIKSNSVVALTLDTDALNFSF